MALFRMVTDVILCAFHRDTGALIPMKFVFVVPYVRETVSFVKTNENYE